MPVRAGPRIQVEVVRRPGEVPGLGAWLARLAPVTARGVVTVALVSDRAMREMNRRYRGVDRVTDVLSFPSTSSATHDARSRRRQAFANAPAGDPGSSEASLGDIAIARGVAARQARAHGHSTAAEVRVLAVHGLLHLLGYDHEHPRDRGAMARLEGRLRRRGGVPEGLISRSQRRWPRGSGPQRQ